MTAAESSAVGSPASQLSLSRALARRVRRERRASWFPLLVFAVVTFLAIPVTRAGHAVGLTCRPLSVPGRPVARVCVAHNSAAYGYWPIALIASYVLIAAFYLHWSRSRGLATRARPYVVTGLVLAVAVTAAAVWAAHTVLTGRYDILGWHLQGQDVYRLIAPACAIGLALLVLAVIDRSPTLLLVSVAYLVLAIGGVDFGWTIARSSPWAFAPHLVIAGSILLLASAGFALVQLPRRRASYPPA
jgi:hypothetical protein